MDNSRFTARDLGGTPPAPVRERPTGASPRHTLSNALLTSAGAIHAEPTTRPPTWPSAQIAHSGHSSSRTRASHYRDGRTSSPPAVALHAARAWHAAAACSGSRPGSTASGPTRPSRTATAAACARGAKQRSERAARTPPRALSSSATDLQVEGHVFARAPTARACQRAPRPSTCGTQQARCSVPSAHAACNILHASRGPRPSYARRRRHAGKGRALVRVGRVDSPRRARPAQ